MPFDTGDKRSALFAGLSGFWQRFFKDAQDIEAYYQASEVYLGQVYLDLLGAVLNIGIVDTPVFNREYWKMFPILETEINFQAGLNPTIGQYLYDMPDGSVSVDFLQNAILEPTIVLERDANFTVADNDGYIRFIEDPFNAEQDSDGNWMPTPGTAWRTVRRAVGNAAYDLGTKLYDASYYATGSAYDRGAQRGDTLRILAYNGNEISTGLTGSILNSLSQTFFDAAGIGNCKAGDVVHVYGHDGSSPGTNDTWKGFYIVKSVVSVNRVEIEQQTIPTTSWSSTANLYWKLNQAIYFDVTGTTPFRDYVQDYYEGVKSIGSPDNPYPLDLEGPVVAAVVRDALDPTEFGVSLTFQTAVTGSAPPVSPFPVGDVGTVTQLAHRHIIPGTVKLNAYKHYTVTPEARTDKRLVEGVDYTVDYLRGVIYQIAYWDATSAGRCDYEHQTEVSLLGAVQVEEYAVGNVRQLSYWVPEVLVDRFNLWYNYGSLLNRFDASSEAYKAFLMGVMYLYMTGPVLQRVESALNVAAEYPVVAQDGEVLLEYDSGENGRGSAASLNGSTDEVTLLPAEYTLGEIDVGGYVIISEALNDSNEGKFRILSVDASTNTALLETSYGLVTEISVAWIITQTYTKTITTTQNTYEYPFSVPIRTDIIDPVNWNTLMFAAFESLTLAFTVTDYVEDPTWWGDSVIPPMLWDASTARRRATTLLFDHVIDSEDGACISDPGLYIGADEEGVVRAPTDPRDLDINTITWRAGTTVRYALNLEPDLSDVAVSDPVTLTVSNATNAANDGTFTITAVDRDAHWVEVTNGARTDSTLDEASNSPATATLTGAVIPLNILRHNVAYVLFDRYLKAHMYYIKFDIGLELDAQFRDDLEEIILIAKPSYTYPAVDTNAIFIDDVGLSEDFDFLVTLLLSGDGDEGLSSLHVADNTLKIGDTDFPWQIGEYYRYSTMQAYNTVTNPIPVGRTVLPVFEAGCSLLSYNMLCHRVEDGALVIEGRDYVINLVAEDPAGTPNPLRWQVEFLTECIAYGKGGTTLYQTGNIARKVTGTYNTTWGHTPICIDGLNPGYIRSGALDPASPTYAAEFEALRTEYVDRPVQLTVVPNTATPTVSYTYP